MQLSALGTLLLGHTTGLFEDTMRSRPHTLFTIEISTAGRDQAAVVNGGDRGTSLGHMWHPFVLQSRPCAVHHRNLFTASTGYFDVDMHGEAAREPYSFPRPSGFEAEETRARGPRVRSRSAVEAGARAHAAPCAALGTTGLPDCLGSPLRLDV